MDLTVISQLSWIDTRDMLADGLTKGSVDRSALHTVMAGTMKLNHPYEVWSSKGPMADMRVFDSANQHDAHSLFVVTCSHFCFAPAGHSNSDHRTTMSQSSAQTAGGSRSTEAPGGADAPEPQGLRQHMWMTLKRAV